MAMFIYNYLLEGFHHPISYSSHWQHFLSNIIHIIFWNYVMGLKLIVYLVIRLAEPTETTD